MVNMTRDELESILGGIVQPLAVQAANTQSRVTPTQADTELMSEIRAEAKRAEAKTEARRKKTDALVAEALRIKEEDESRPKPAAGSTAEGKDNISELFEGLGEVSDLVNSIIGG
jgi:hypothetical protein